MTESSPRRRAALWMTPEEADAFLNVLMTAPPSEAVPAPMAERLLCRVADVRRALLGGRPRASRCRRAPAARSGGRR